jgi:hypothetical protein
MLATEVDLLQFMRPCHLEWICPHECFTPALAVSLHALLWCRSTVHNDSSPHMQVMTRQMMACRQDRHTSSHTMCQTALVPARLSPAARCGCALPEDLALVSLCHY